MNFQMARSTLHHSTCCALPQSDGLASQLKLRSPLTVSITRHVSPYRARLSCAPSGRPGDRGQDQVLGHGSRGGQEDWDATIS
jgi:hypothetical protein